MVSELEAGVSHAVDFPENRSAPILIEVTRGGMVESIHRGFVLYRTQGDQYTKVGEIMNDLYIHDLQ